MNNETSQQIADFFDKLINQQEKKVRDLARRLVPQITDEDILNPHDYEELRENGHFNYEDGYLAALLAAKMAFKSESI